MSTRLTYCHKWVKRALSRCAALVSICQYLKLQIYRDGYLLGYILFARQSFSFVGKVLLLASQLERVRVWSAERLLSLMSTRLTYCHKWVKRALSRCAALVSICQYLKLQIYRDGYLLGYILFARQSFSFVGKVLLLAGQLERVRVWSAERLLSLMSMKLTYCHKWVKRALRDALLLCRITLYILCLSV